MHNKRMRTCILRAFALAVMNKVERDQDVWQLDLVLLADIIYDLHAYV
jgi:hypothetical protein